MTNRPALIPQEGVDRCYCGVKYWDKVESDLPPYFIYICHSCEEPYEPPFDYDGPDIDAHHDAFLAGIDEEAEARSGEAAHHYGWSDD